MKEIEVKAKVENFEFILSKLKELGCSLSEPLIQKDRIYLHKDLRFEEITKGSVILRIRDSNGKIILTLKKQCENELDDLESEVVVGNLDKAEEFLNHLDFHEVIKVNKKRIKCNYKDYEICLDEVEKLGQFVEVEKLTNDEEDSLKVQAELFAFLESLGVKKEDQVFQGYDTLIFNKK